MAKHGGGCSLRRCAKGLALTGYTSATRLAPPVFDPCRSGLARSVTIISQLRSKATKQLIPPQHPIDAFFSLGGNAWASPRLIFHTGLQIGWNSQRSTSAIQPARGKQIFPNWMGCFGQSAAICFCKHAAQRDLRFDGRSMSLVVPRTQCRPRRQPWHLHSNYLIYTGEP